MCSASRFRRGPARGITLIGLLFWLMVFGFLALVGMKTFPTVTEYYAIKRAVDKVAREGGSTVPEIRSAFDKQKEIEYGIESISSKDLDITKDPSSGQVVVSFAYDKEIEIFDPVYLLIKYAGESK